MSNPTPIRSSLRLVAAAHASGVRSPTGTQGATRAGALYAGASPAYPRHGDRSPRRADPGARGETIGIDPAGPARPNEPRSAPPRRHGFEERLFVDGGEHPLRAGSPAQVVKPERRHRLRRGCHLRTPRSGTGAKDETRRPQTGSVCGWKGAERIMPKTLRFGQVSGHHPSCVIRATRQAKSRKTGDDGSPCARGCCAHVLASRYGLDARDTRASLGFASDGSEFSGITGIDLDVDSIPSRGGGQDAVTYV